MKIWLDDIRPAPKGWIWVKDFWEAKKIIHENPGKWEAISLDHDLGDWQSKPEKTGYDVLMLIVDQFMMDDIEPGTIHIHTANPVARERMIGVIKRYLI